MFPLYFLLNFFLPSFRPVFLLRILYFYISRYLLVSCRILGRNDH